MKVTRSLVNGYCCVFASCRRVFVVGYLVGIFMLVILFFRFCFASCFLVVIQGCWRFFSFLRRFVIVFVYRWYYHVCLFVVISFMIPLSFSLSQEVSTGYTEVCNTSGGDSNRNIGRGNAVIIFTGCTSVTVQIITVMQTGNPSRI